MEVSGGEERAIKILVGVFYHTGLSFEKNHPIFQLSSINEYNE